MFSAVTSIDELLSKHTKLTKEKQAEIKSFNEFLYVFDFENFLEKLPKAYRAIMENFAKEDIDQIADLLTEDMHEKLSYQIDRRNEKGLHLDIEIVSLDEIMVIDAIKDEEKAYLKVLLTSTQGIEEYDSDNNLTRGDSDKYIEIKEEWVFEKDKNARTTAWLLNDIKPTQQDAKEEK